jgi:hypothetical protein
VEHWTEPVTMIERALRLSQSLGKKEPLITTVLEEIERRVVAADGNDPYFYTHRLVKCLLLSRHGDPAQWAELLEKVAKKEHESAHRAEQHWKLVIDAHHAAQNPEKVDAAIAACGEMWARFAEEESTQPHFSRFIIADHLEHAIAWLRSNKQHRQWVRTLRKKLVDVQDESLDEMGLFVEHFSTDDPKVLEAVQEYLKRVRQPNPLLSVVALGNLAKPPTFEYTETQVREAQGRYGLSALLPTKPVGARGQNVMKPPSTQNEQFLVEFFSHRNLARQGQIAFLEPARCAVLEHPLHHFDLLELLDENVLIVPGHEELVLRGLVAGLQGDFVIAAHLLIPQIEAGLRHLLQMCGVTTSGFTQEGVQNEHSLNTLLEEPEFASILEQAFSKGVVYELRGLLIDRAGANIRNNMAHGLLGHDEFHSSTVATVFYLSLYLFTRPFIWRIEKIVKSQETASTHKTEEHA